MLKCVAVCYSVLQCVAVRCNVLHYRLISKVCVSCCSVLQCVLQCVAVRCSALQCTAPSLDIKSVLRGCECVLSRVIVGCVCVFVDVGVRVRVFVNTERTNDFFLKAPTHSTTQQ